MIQALNGGGSHGSLRPYGCRVERARTLVAEEVAGGRPCGRPARSERHLLAPSIWRAMGRHSRTLWAANDLLQSLCPVAQGGHLGLFIESRFRGLRRQSSDDRQFICSGPSARRQRGEKRGLSRCMGRSRGGLTTKIHARVDAHGLPIALKLTEGQAHDGKSAEDMVEALGKDVVLLADRAYDSDALRTKLAAQGALANIRPLDHRKNPPAFSRAIYRLRNRIERFFNKLKHFRAIATRFDKHDANYLASIKLAALRIWMRFNESVT